MRELGWVGSGWEVVSGPVCYGTYRPTGEVLGSDRLREWSGMLFYAHTGRAPLDCSAQHGAVLGSAEWYREVRQ